MYTVVFNKHIKGCYISSSWEGVVTTSIGILNNVQAYFFYILTFIFEIITYKRIRTVLAEQEVPLCKLLI